MKLLYIAALPIDFENLDGVPKKVISQCKALGKDFGVDLIFYHGGQVRLRELSRGGERSLGRAKNKLDVLRAATDLVREGGYGCRLSRGKSANAPKGLGGFAGGPQASKSVSAASREPRKRP